MKIRRIDIENFRGIKKLAWVLPRDISRLALIGPGDSCKSTILCAIDMALSDRRTLPFDDTDFYGTDVRDSISIRVTLGELSNKVLAHDVLGMNLCGIDANGQLHQDPADHHEACVIVELNVDDTLEPRWTAYRPDKDSEPDLLRGGARTLLTTHMLDERVDAQLRWTRSTTLGRLTEDKTGTTGLLAGATRAAREAVVASVPDELKKLTLEIQNEVNSSGSGNFESLRPGFDQSITSGLALFEGKVPLSKYGLASRRLAAIAIQRMDKTTPDVVLIDEIEHGLEPHRLVGLLGRMKRDENSSQVLFTTHSPTALQYLDAGEITIVRRTSNGTVSAKTPTKELQPLLRTAPQAFLARRVLVCEGKTELGIAMEFIESLWDRVREQRGAPISASLGVCIVFGSNGANALAAAEQLHQARYEVAAFIDSDVLTDVSTADALVSDGISVIRWKSEHRTETAVTETLDIGGLQQLIDLAMKNDDTPPQHMIDRLRNWGLPQSVTSTVISDWISQDYPLSEARKTIANAAHKYDWFKQIGRGRQLARLMLAGANYQGSDAEKKMGELETFIYATSADSSSEE